MGASTRQCQVCKEAQSKYKCPPCLIPFCPDTRITKKPLVPNQILLGKNCAERPVDVDGPSEVSQKLKLDAIASSGEICNALKDEHLQKLIRDIDKSPDPIEILDKAMGTDVFRLV